MLEFVANRLMEKLSPVLEVFCTLEVSTSRVDCRRFHGIIYSLLFIMQRQTVDDACYDKKACALDRLSVTLLVYWSFLSIPAGPFTHAESISIIN